MNEIEKIESIIGNSKTGVQMTYGKHKGLDLSDISNNYLEWVITTDCSDKLKESIENELLRREELNINIY